MKCDEAGKFSHDYFEKTIRADEAHELQDHLRICNVCLIEFNKLRIYFEKIEGIPELLEMPDHLLDEIVSELHKVNQKRISKDNGSSSVNQLDQKNESRGSVKTIQRQKANSNKTKEEREFNFFIIVVIVAVIMLFIALYKFVL